MLERLSTVLVHKLAVAIACHQVDNTPFPGHSVSGSKEHSRFVGAARVTLLIIRARSTTETLSCGENPSL